MDMGKRFTEITKWGDPWFYALKSEHKLFWVYLCENCDNAGFWEEPQAIFEAKIGIQGFDLAGAIQALGDRVTALPTGGYWVTKFIDFQNPKGLTDSNYHKPILQSIAKNSIPYPTHAQDLPKSRSWVQYKDKDSSLGFDQFWKAYPKKVGKKAALKEWQKLNPPLEAVLKSVMAHKGSDKWKRGFILDPERWIKGEHWNDEVQGVADTSNLSRADIQVALDRKRTAV